MPSPVVTLIRLHEQSLAVAICRTFPALIPQRSLQEVFIKYKFPRTASPRYQCRASALQAATTTPNAVTLNSAISVCEKVKGFVEW